MRGQKREGRATLHLMAHTLLAADQKSSVHGALKEKSPPPSLPASQPVPFSVSSISQPFCRCSSHPFCILFALSGCILEPAFSVHSPLFKAPWVHQKDRQAPIEETNSLHNNLTPIIKKIKRHKRARCIDNLSQSQVFDFETLSLPYTWSAS